MVYVHFNHHTIMTAHRHTDPGGRLPSFSARFLGSVDSIIGLPNPVGTIDISRRTTTTTIILIFLHDAVFDGGNDYDD